MEIFISLFFLAFSVWFILEVVEFIKWDYEIPGRKVGISLFVLRFLPLIPVFLYFGNIRYVIISLIAPLLAFYGYLLLPLLAGIGLCFFIFGAQLAIGLIYPVFPASHHHPVGDDLFLVVYPLMNILLMSLFAFFWKKDRGQRRENAALTRTLQETHAQLKSFAEQVSDTVALEERTRLARDIHDSLGHNLTAVSIQLNKAEAFFRKDEAEAFKAITEARASIHEAMQDIRSVLQALNDERSGFDIFEQIRKTASVLLTEHYTLAMDLQGRQEGFNNAVLLAVYRLFQEGITNILKHSEADHVELRLILREEDALAELKDNGRGFLADLIYSDRGGIWTGYGLTGLLDRIQLMRGTLVIESAPGEGTRLRAILPKQPSELIGRGR